MRLQPARLVFIDETAVNTKMTRLRGRSRRGQRLRASAPFGRWGTQTFIAALRCDGLTAPWVVDGAMDRAAFNAYVETQLAPTLRPGDVVIPLIRRSATPLRRPMPPHSPQRAIGCAPRPAPPITRCSAGALAPP